MLTTACVRDGARRPFSRAEIHGAYEASSVRHGSGGPEDRSNIKTEMSNHAGIGSIERRPAPPQM